MPVRTQPLHRIKQLLELYRAGKIPVLAQHEVHPKVPKSSRERYLYFTLPVSINFQRNSPAMWRSALKTYEDPKTRYVFFPEKVTKKNPLEVQKDLFKYRLALQPNRHTHIWLSISKTLAEQFKDDPRNIIKAVDSDVRRFIDLLQNSHKPHFPYLSGPKLSNYWPYILSHYTSVKWKNPEEISIIPDTHVIQSTVWLKLVPPNANSGQVVEAWKNMLRGSGINPAEMHPVLWNWSRNNFQPIV